MLDTYQKLCPTLYWLLHICVYSIHAIGLHSSAYLIYLIYCAFNPHRPWLRLSQAKAKLSLTALAQPVDFESLSCRKPGQSHSFQAKPGWNITSSNECGQGQQWHPAPGADTVHMIGCRWLPHYFLVQHMATSIDMSATFTRLQGGWPICTHRYPEYCRLHTTLCCLWCGNDLYLLQVQCSWVWVQCWKTQPMVYPCDTLAVVAWGSPSDWMGLYFG